jgi:hypothetical protein
LCACEGKKNENDDLIIARVNEKLLFKTELANSIPTGLNKQDSINFVNQYVNSWIKNQLVLQKAEELLPEETKNVAKKLEEYRISLLSYEYEEIYIKKRLDTLVKDKEIESYYKNHLDDFILKDYIVKCLLITCDNSVPELNKVKQSYLLKNEEDELFLRSFAQNYNAEMYYNAEEWIYFDDLMKKVPIEDYNKRRFIQRKKKVFIEEGGNLYFINIYDYKLKDETSPLSFEKEKIKSIILNIRMNELRKKLRLDLYNDAIKNNAIENYVND